MKKVVWQPEFYRGFEFKVWVGNDFAMEMLNTPFSGDEQRRINELATEKLKEIRINCPEPYSFYKNSAFIHHFNLGSDGRWLSTNNPSIERRIKNGGLPELVEYNSHNIDTSKQAFALLSLVSMWHYYSDTF